MTTPLSALRFAYDWEPGDGVRSPELAATWCRLEIWVGQDCVSRVEDRESGSTRRSLYGSLYPIAEWIAYNWWLIRAHTRPTALPSHQWSFSQLRNVDRREYAWLRHHNVRGAGDGFLWPNMTIVPEGPSTRVRWVRDASVADTCPVRFISDGERSVDSGETQVVLADLVESVIARLHEQGIGKSALEVEWRMNADLPSEQGEFCIAAARLGLDPYSVREDDADALVRAGMALDDRILGEFLDAVDPTALDTGLDWITTSSRLLHSSNGPTDQRLDAVREAVDSTLVGDGGRPWTIGYGQAARARLALDLDRADPFASEDVISILRSAGSDHRLQALGGRSGTGSPALALNMRSTSSATRFAAARAIWHFGSQPGRDRFLLTPARTDAHKIERAFAAELLAPADGLREALADVPLPISDEDLDAAAAQYGVSPLVIRHQVDNQLLAT